MVSHGHRTRSHARRSGRDGAAPSRAWWRSRRPRGNGMAAWRWRRPPAPWAAT
jgi:hypothetical protein